MKTTTFALSLLLSQYAVDGQLANTAQRRVSPTDRFANPSHKQHRTLRTARTLQEDDDGSMSLATDVTSMSMAVEPETKDMFETTEESIEAVEPQVGGGFGGVDPYGSGSSKGGKTSKTSKATKLFKSAKSADAKAEKASKATKTGRRELAEKISKASKAKSSKAKSSKAKGEKMR